jgi:hypothetical protein
MEQMIQSQTVKEKSKDIKKIPKIINILIDFIFINRTWKKI